MAQPEVVVTQPPASQTVVVDPATQQQYTVESTSAYSSGGKYGRSRLLWRILKAFLATALLGALIANAAWLRRLWLDHDDDDHSKISSLWRHRLWGHRDHNVTSEVTSTEWHAHVNTPTQVDIPDTITVAETLMPTTTITRPRSAAPAVSSTEPQHLRRRKHKPKNTYTTPIRTSTVLSVHTTTKTVKKTKDSTHTRARCTTGCIKPPRPTIPVSIKTRIHRTTYTLTVGQHGSLKKTTIIAWIPASNTPVSFQTLPSLPAPSSTAMVSHVPRHHKSKLTIPAFTATVTDGFATTMTLEFPVKTAKVKSKKPGHVHSVQYTADLMPAEKVVKEVSHVEVTKTKTETVRRVFEVIAAPTQAAGMADDASHASENLEKRKQRGPHPGHHKGHGQTTFSQGYTTKVMGTRTFSFYLPDATVNWENDNDGLNRPAYLLPISPSTKTVTSTMTLVSDGQPALAGMEDCDCTAGSDCMTKSGEPTTTASTFATLDRSHTDAVDPDASIMIKHSDNGTSVSLGPQSKPTTTTASLIPLPPPGFPPVVISASTADIENGSSA